MVKGKKPANKKKQSVRKAAAVREPAEMIEIRWHGRGGQGVVSVAQFVGLAALHEGKFIQAFPEFGPERTGAPIKAFDRISEGQIELHSQVYAPDIVLVIDPTLLSSINVTEGLKKGGLLIVNSPKDPHAVSADLKAAEFKVHTVDATRIAMDTFGKPLFNTAMLGALVKVSGIVSLDSVLQVVSERFTGKIGELNLNAIKRAYEEAR